MFSEPGSAWAQGTPRRQWLVLAQRCNAANEIFPEYKANREPAPQELKRQFKWAREVAESLGLRCFADLRFEADDLIGTLSEYWRARGHSLCVVSSDKDLAQLIQEGDIWWDF